MRDITVGDLMTLLEELPEDMPIRLAHQPTYPLQFMLVERVRRYKGVAYLLEGDHPREGSPYLPKSLWDEGDDDTGDLVCDGCEEPTSYVTDASNDDVDEGMPICTRCAGRDGIEIVQVHAPQF